MKQGSKPLITLKIPEGVTEIENEAYFDRWDIEAVMLPSSLKRIGDSAFQECVNLKNINFPEGLVEIGVAAFSHCHALDVEIPENVTLGTLAFDRRLTERKKQ